MNKKGMEIAINQIVILIIGIAIVGLGLALVGKIMSSGDSQIEAANANIRAQFERSLSSDELVDIPLKSRKMQAKDLEIYHLGIYNDASVSENNDFHIIVTGSGGDDEKMMNALQILDAKPTTGITKSQGILETIENGEVGVIPIGFLAKEGPLGMGQYTYNVCVCDGEDCLGNNGGSVTQCTSESIQNIDNLYDFITFSATVR
ncbi:hypothetical protein KY321_02545 [Candidatus Woesearchaeota archaeon]|nr:hypothetical protein [Candidatus Woesearchaeota archaeon]